MRNFRHRHLLCNKPIGDPRKAGEVWTDGEGIAPFSSAACTLGAYAQIKAKGKKINVAYVFDTTRGIKLFADQAYFAVAADKTEIAPFLLKKDAEAYAAKTGGKVLGFDDALKSVVSRGLAWRAPALRREPRAQPEPAAARSFEVPMAAPSSPQLMTSVRRWFLLNRGGLRAVAIGAVSLMLFLLAWHLLTTYRVVFFVRFINVPSPAAVTMKSLNRAMHDSKFLMHVMLSCRRILLGFSLAAIVAVPLGLVMGRFKLVHEMVFPVTEILRPIPAIAWVPMAIMLWPTNEQSIVFITFLGSFFPILVNTLHGMSLVDPVLVRASQCLGAREMSIFREVYFPASLPHIFTGLTVGMGVAWVSLIAAEMISGQYGIGYFTWEAYSLVQYPDIALGMICIGVLGLGSSALIRGLGRLVMPWNRS